jgi:RNA polymerase sigma-70 factor (ECF subfamily)
MLNDSSTTCRIHAGDVCYKLKGEMVKSPYQPSKLSMQEQNWAMLISQIAQGNESALRTLYDHTSRLIYGLALRILADVSKAEEITIEVYMQVWRKAIDYDARRSTPSAWLFMLTRSRAIDRLRSDTQRNKLEGSLEVNILSPAANPEETTLMVEQRKLIQDALAKLTLQQRNVIELAYFSGLSQSEIASKLHQPVGTVKSWIRLGMMKLRELLSPRREE